MTYHMCEIFHSLQGEGWFQGLPTVFVRLSGCNLRCRFCDTPQAFEESETLDEADIVARVRSFDCDNVCLTGGEPFLQNLQPLAHRLKAHGMRLAVETNGTLWQDIAFDWITVSPKKEGKRFHPAGFDERFRTRAHEFKYVIAGPDDFSLLDTSLRQPVILQPVDNDPAVARMIETFLKENRLPNSMSDENYINVKVVKMRDIK